MGHGCHPDRRVDAQHLALLHIGPVVDHREVDLVSLQRLDLGRGMVHPHRDLHPLVPLVKGRQAQGQDRAGILVRNPDPNRPDPAASPARPPPPRPEAPRRGRRRAPAVAARPGPPRAPAGRTAADARLSSSRFTCRLTADCVRYSRPATAVTEPRSATARKLRIRSLSRVASSQTHESDLC